MDSMKNKDQPEHPTLLEALQALQGERLSSVEFVQNYVQLRFDGPCLTVFNPHRIRSAQNVFASGEPCYADALCKLINYRIQSISFNERSELALTFDEQIVWRVSLDDEDYSGPEAVTLVTENGIWVV